ncbi:MAG: YigZ family protein [Cyclobacteriaceae bacterium]|nr:YigZ family protein [Cyclobacteriaceae bacterium]MCH8515676.1 YigZ family protein [Cyclobacteriaceae bacterium]
MSSSDQYRVIRQSAESLYKEKGSKFIGHVFFVGDEDEVKLHLEDLRSRYHDARHYCYAYVLGYEGDQFRANDDGEPAHSAGDPILGQIRSSELTFCLVVVIRYFGGTKLGVSGLINAYKTAAEAAIAEAGVEERFQEVALAVSFEYPAMGEVMKIVDQEGVRIDNQQFELDCQIKLSVRASLYEKVKNDFEAYSPKRIEIIKNKDL